METGDAPVKVFVSYSQHDKAWADWIIDQLTSAGYTVFAQSLTMRAGAHWPSEINRVVQAADHTIAVVSASYQESEICQVEWLAAWRRDPAGRLRRLIPVRVQDCRVEGLLGAIVYIDLFDLTHSAADARARLLGAVGDASEAHARAQSDQHSPTRVRADDPAYLAQVRQIAPRRLLDREAELAELARFCTELQQGSYLWWRAPAWQGKSALLSWFVLHPPPGVHLVAFFITARYAGNNDRAAFVEAVTEQFAGLLGESIPPFLPDAAREHLYLHLLAAAATACQARGDRLILLVDGLDEDRGAVGEPAAGSIAALLPKNPPDGLRVVVAGRPDPPLPADVGTDHPLRNPAILRSLPASPHASTARADMQRDLDRLRKGSPLARDVLGLITAAGGGLSSRDLAELCADRDASEYDVDELLSSIAGRSFMTRPAQWAADAPAVFVLGHEEIQQAAVRAFSAAQLAGYRQRITAWAANYRDCEWPPGTPEYLLRGYYRLLHASGEWALVVACASDLARHDRMLDLTGGDTAALAEITDAQNALLAQPDLDLRLLARLAFHRHRVVERNSNIPAELPAVWALLGQASRAEQLANGIPDPYRRVQARAALAAVAEPGGRIDDLADQAEQAASRIRDERTQAHARTDLAARLSDAGAFDRAERVVRGITDPDIQTRALIALAGTLMTADRPAEAAALLEQAEQAVSGMRSSYLHREAATELIGALVRAGQDQRAELVAEGWTSDDTAERGWRDAEDEGWVWAELAVAFGRTGRSGQVHAAIARAEQALGHRRELPWRGELAATFARALVQAGQIDGALQVAQSVESMDDRVAALIGLVGELARTGRAPEGIGVARQVEQVAQGWGAGYHRARTLAELVGALAEAGVYDEAERILSGIPEPAWRGGAGAQMVTALARAGRRDQLLRIVDQSEPTSGIGGDPASFDDIQAITRLAFGLARAGEIDRARQLAEQAERSGRAIIDRRTQHTSLRRLAVALVRAGELDAGEYVIDRIVDPRYRDEGRADLVVPLTEASEDQRARRLADAAPIGRDVHVQVDRLAALIGLGRLDEACTEALRIEQTVCRARPWYPQTRAMSALVVGLAGAGRYSTAEQMVAGITEPERYVRAAGALLTSAPDVHQADRLIDGATRAVHNIADEHFQFRDALLGLVEVVAASGRFTQAIRIGHGGHDPYQRSDCLAIVATAMIGAGELEEAAGLVEQAGREREQAEDPLAPYRLWDAQAELAMALARRGHHDRAESVARRITNPNVAVEVWPELILALANAGLSRQAHRLSIAAEEAIAQSGAPKTSSTASTRLMQALLRAGLAAAAERIPVVANAQFDRAQLLSGLVAALYRASRHHRADEVIDGIEPLARRARVAAALAAEQVTAGEHEQAIRTAGRAARIAAAVDDPRERSAALLDIVSALTGSTILGLDLPGVGTDVRWPAEVTTTAEHLAVEIPDAQTRATALVALGCSLAATGEREACRRVVTACLAVAPQMRNRVIIKDPDPDDPDFLDYDEQRNELTRLALALARAGDFIFAERTIEAIQDLDSRADALFSLAEAMAAAARPRSRAWVADALTIGDWTSLRLSKVVFAVPEVIAEFGDLVLATPVPSDDVNL